MIFSGCTEKTSTEIQTPEGKITVSEGVGAGPEWCKAGTTSTYSSNAPGNQGSANLIIKGITTYKGRQVCEAEGKVAVAGMESLSYLQYYTQDGKYSAMIMKDSSGKVLSENEVNNP
ncbi:MAG: hypothetical protein KKA10_00455 [Euryarchaeota archaeon]|nr:hypothetical protein [Euryarchaeota archaeon]MCG2735465.1 hypothetical protein [Candidatus Methanoperedenaceae archaeon]